MISKMETLLKYFVGTASQERGFINDIFVTLDSFKDIIDVKERSVRLLVGDKGSGKSAVIEFLRRKCEEGDVPVLLLTPDDLEIENIKDDLSSSQIKRILYISLIKEIAIRAGTNFKKFLPNDYEDVLIRKAEEAGARSEGWLTSAIRYLSPIGKSLSNVEFSSMIQLPNERQVIEAVKTAMNDKPAVFYLLIDDIDQIGNSKSRNYVDIIFSAILAVKKVAEELPNIRPIITLRTEIWRRICGERNSQRDQVDHLRTMVRTLVMNDRDMYNIIKKRLELCAIKLGLPL